MDVLQEGDYVAGVTSRNVMTSPSHVMRTTGDNHPQRLVTSQQLNSQSVCVGGLPSGLFGDDGTQLDNPRIAGGLDWRPDNEPRLRYHYQTFKLLTAVKL